MQKLMILLLGFVGMQQIQAQELKTLSAADFSTWRTIGQRQMSQDGKYLVFSTTADDADPDVNLIRISDKKQVVYPHSDSPKLSEDGHLLLFTKKTEIDSLKQMKRKKVKKDDLPKDSLVIINIRDNKQHSFYNISKSEFSNKWKDLAILQLPVPNYKKDSLATARDLKRQSEENGQDVLIFHPLSNKTDTLRYVKKFSASSDVAQVYVWTTGPDSSSAQAIVRYLPGSRLVDTIATGKWKDVALFPEKDGTSMVALVTSDSVNFKNGPREILFWTAQNKSLSQPSIPTSIMPAGWQIPSYSRVSFVEGSEDFYLGVAPVQMQQDTNLLEEEIVKVEVWHSEDPYLYTMQESRLEESRRKTYRMRYVAVEDKFIQVEDENMDFSLQGHEGKGDYLLVLDRSAYLKQITWEGNSLADLYILELKTGEKSLIKKGISGIPRLSPSANHAVWFDREHAQWMYLDLKTRLLSQVMPDFQYSFADEQNDVPAKAGDYGMGGWIEGETGFYINDRYDVWKVLFSDVKKGRAMTSGRSTEMVSRIISTRDESPYTSASQLYLRRFDEKSKKSGYYKLTIGKNAAFRQLAWGDYDYGDNWLFTPDLKTIVYTKENFQTFPDLIKTSDDFKTSQRLTDVNPQQADYRWGSIELISWTNPSGEELQGLLVKPAGFESGKTYPMLINFYERSSDGLNGYRSPLAGRSSINYSYYASKGYVIFNPDITYRDGYPGESCYEDLMSGVDAVLALGFVDSTRMGLQGHSWGGYQVAYLLGRTNRFKCAESGAPVVNMTSAYGGIRWESGMSRMFQYEKTQSRIGTTLWDNRDLYLDNSPLFMLPNVETPVLILHNDEDGAVPWYQGIEYFVGLRRLGKQAWLLNYNGEPHWPVKYQNRKDFNIRMEQFFDHFLMDKPMPEWMVKGVPALEKGINKGY